MGSHLCGARRIQLTTLVAAKKFWDSAPCPPLILRLSTSVRNVRVEKKVA